jgi:hypothetical protein
MKKKARPKWGGPISFGLFREEGRADIFSALLSHNKGVVKTNRKGGLT